MTVRLSRQMRDLLTTLADLRVAVASATAESRYRHMSAGHQKALRELKRARATKETKETNERR